MQWLQVRFEITQAQVELVETILLSLGAHSVVLDDAADQPLLEPLPGETPIWDEVIITGLFDEAHNADTITAFVQAQTTVKSVTVEYIDEQAWERAWMDHYQPFACGDRLWIVPEWLEPPVADAVNLKLDPGLAFGTGDHPSTFMCLKWLDGQPLAGKTVVDYGCGSGILGVAALLLGAQYVWAVDIDPQAIIATRQNADNNGVGDKLWVGLPEAFEALQTRMPVDVVVANILAGPLVELSPKLAGFCQPKGDIILAGLIQSQVAELLEVYGQWFDIKLQDTLEEDWCLLAGKKR